MSSGVEEIVPMAGYGQKEDELDGTTNFKPLIDSLLITKDVSQKQNQMVQRLNQKAHLRQDCLPSIPVQDGTSSW